MKNRKNKFLALGLGVVLGLSCVFSSYATSADLKDAKKKVSSLQEEKKKVQDTLKQLEGLKSDAAAYVKELDKKLTSLDSELSQLEKDISAKEDQIENTKAELEEAKAVEKEQYASMKLRIQYMYENGNVSFADSIMTSKNASQLLNRAEYASQIATYDRKMLKEYQNMQVTIADTQKTLETDYASLQSLQAKVQEEKQAVAALESAKKGELNDVADDLTDAQTVAKAYEAEIQAQNEVIAQIQAAQKRAAEQQAAQQQAQAAEENQGATDAAGENQNTAQNTTPSGNGQSTGSMMWPCPSSKRVTSDYGPRTSPTNGASSNHKGIDIGAAYGADIVAADGGTVLVATYSSSGGNYVIIDHGGGLCTVYMHASSLTVSAGQTVSKGQVIAKVGSTGISTGNHLHFGVTLNGVYVSPWGYVS